MGSSEEEEDDDDEDDAAATAAKQKRIKIDTKFIVLIALFLEKLGSRVSVGIVGKERYDCRSLICCCESLSTTKSTNLLLSD